jgi:hypothetical protein
MSSPVLSDISESDLTSTTPPDYVPDPPAQGYKNTNILNLNFCNISTNNNKRCYGYAPNDPGET